MASIWRIGGVDIYVTDHQIKGDVKLAKLTPLDSVASSTLHYFGSGAEEVSLKGWLFSEANLTSVESFRNNGTTVALVSDQGSEGNYKIESFDVEKFGPFVRLSLTGYDPEDTTIYTFQAKLIKV